MAITTTYTYDEAGNFTFDSDKITLDSSVAELELQSSNLPFTEDFADDTDFTYDATKTEFSGGQVQQKDITPADSTFHAGFEVDGSYNASWGDGSLVPAQVQNSPTVINGQAQFLVNDILGYDGTLNANTAIQTGCVRIRYIPQYSGTPTDVQYLFQIQRGTTDGRNLISITHSNNGNLYINMKNAAGGYIIQPSLGAWSPTAGQTYEFELNYNLDTGLLRCYRDGASIYYNTGITGTRDSNIGYIQLGVGTAANWIESITLFDAVQHSGSSYVVGDDVTDYKYIDTTVTLPEMEHTLPGTILEGVSFATTESGTPRYTIQVGQSGTYLYHDGVDWTTSDGTYAQANTAADFNTNFPTLDVDGEEYGQFKIHFTDSNTQASVSELTATMSVNTGYLTTNPDIVVNSATEMDELIGFSETSSKAGSDEIKYTLKIGTTEYYYSGATWAASDGTYSQANTATEINTNATDFSDILGNGAAVKVNAFLHSDDGLTTPELSEIELEYSFYSVGEDLDMVTVYGYVYNNETAVEDAEIVVRTSAAFIDNNNLIDVNTSTTTRSNGYFEIELPKTDDAGVTLDVTIEYLDEQGWTKKKEYTINVTGLASQEAFEDLIV